MSLTPPSVRTRAPLLGEHTNEILSSLGYDPAQVADLRHRAVV
jgi:crotonobetainyl-CoA:carnitine CoA-transferase CaiB-like acyl-CoA transferase